MLVASCLAFIPAARAQGVGPACRAALPAAAAERLTQCEAFGPCRNIVRILDSCAALGSWLARLAANGPAVDESSTRLALVAAGVPPAGLAYCTAEFNRALCRQFLRVEDAAGALAVPPDAPREQLLRAETQRLADQQQRARLPADAHRFAAERLARCAESRRGPPAAQEESPCREAVDAVTACEHARDDWLGRREAALAEAERGGFEPLVRTLRALQMPACPHTLAPGDLTPAQALAAIQAARAEAAVPAPGAATPAPAAQTDPASVRARIAATYGHDCKLALLRLEDHLDGVRRRRPPLADPLAVAQVNLYLLGEQIAVLESLCRGQREFDFHPTLQDSLARSTRACRESAADARLCVPRLAW